MRQIFPILLFLALNFSLLAQPTTITWQGKLLDAGGNAITQNNVAMTFVMFDASAAGTQLWPISGVVTKTVNVAQGLYSVQLGTGTGDDIAFTAAMFDGKTPWLEVKVGTETLPRTEITNVPFALISNDLSATGWENPGEIGKTTPNTGKFTSLETGSITITDGAASGKVLTSDASGGASWIAPVPAWSMLGNSGTDPLTHFIGTTDNKALVFKVNNERAGYLGTNTNTSFGHLALTSLIIGFYNTAGGAGALHSNISGSTNTGFGAAALYANLGGGSNTATGAMSLYANTTGGSNTAFGASALAKNTSGELNTAVGAGAGAGTANGMIDNETGSNSVFLGAYCNAGANGNTNEIVIGYNATGSGSNTVTLGNSSITATILRGNTNIGGSLKVNESGANTSLTFPASRGTAGQFLKTDGAGATSWSSLTRTDVGLGSVENTALSTWAGSANITTVGTIATGAWSGTAITIAKGGTGASTKTAGFDALSPMTTQGDVIYGGSGGTGTRLAKGNASQVLAMNTGATAPEWKSLSKSDVGLGNVENTALTTWTGSANITTLGTISTGAWNGSTIAVNKGGTGAITKSAGFDALSPMTTQGDIIFGGTSGTGTRLPKGTTGQVLKMNSGATAPEWGSETDPSVPIGTQTGQMQYWSGTGWETVAAGVAGQILTVNASGIPEWQSQLSIITASTRSPIMGSGGIQFNGNFNPNNLASAVYFEYGSSTSYGNTTDITVYNPHTGNISISASIGPGLTEGATYHVRLVVKTIMGTFYSNDVTFNYLYIGCHYKGGYVFTMDDTGQHGKVCSDNNLSSSATWSEAVVQCANNEVNTPLDPEYYNDWYLPAIEELQLMYGDNGLRNLASLNDGNYWSRDVNGSDEAYYVSFYDGTEYSEDKSNNYVVRAVRDF